MAEIPVSTMTTKLIPVQADLRDEIIKIVEKEKYVGKKQISILALVKKLEQERIEIDMGKIRQAIWQLIENKKEGLKINFDGETLILYF